MSGVREPLSDERLAEIRSTLDYLGASVFVDGMLRDLVAEVDRLRAELEQRDER